MENGGPMAMMARVRTLPVARGVVLLVGGLLDLVGLFLPWTEEYHPLDYSVAGSPPDPTLPVFHWSPMSYVFMFFLNGSVSASVGRSLPVLDVGVGLACGAVFLAPPLALVAQGLRVCVTRRWRATGGAVAAAVAGLAVVLLVILVYAYPVLNDTGTWTRPDIGLAVIVVGYICALVAGGNAWKLRLDE